MGYALLLADVLTPADMGELSVAVAVAMIGTVVSKCGLDVHLLRRAAVRPSHAGPLAVRCGVVAGLAGALFCLVCVSVAPDLRPGTAWPFALFQLAVPFLAVSFVLAGLLKAGNLSAAAVFLDTGGWQTAMCLCAVLMHAAGSTSLAVAAACFAGAAPLMCAATFAMARQVLDRCRTVARSGSAVRIRVLETVPLAAVSVGQILMRWSDTLWLAWWLDTQIVAAYVVCTRLAGGIGLADHAVNAVVAPRLARHHERGDARFLRLEFRRACVMSAAFGISGATAMAFVGPAILAHLGPPYEDFVGFLLVAAALMVVHVTLVPVAHLAAMSGRALDHLKATGAMLALQQIAYLLLIPRFGVEAALVGFALPQALANLTTLAMLRHRRGLGRQGQ